MSVVRTIDGRIVLRRSRESRVLHAIGMVGAILLVPAAVYLFDAWRGSWLLFAVVVLAALAVSVPVLKVLLDQYSLRIILSESYISFERWYGSPKVYTYQDVNDIENVKVDEDSWAIRGSHVKLTFTGGEMIRIGHGLVSARMFRKLLREKSGKTFRKRRKKNHE